MKNNILTQGTIIQYIRSSLYPSIKCKGIVITARCDLEHKKAKRIYFLTAITLESWIYSVGFNKIIEDYKKRKFDRIRIFTNNKDMDFLTLSSFPLQKIEQVCLDKCESKQETKNIQDIFDGLRWLKKVHEEPSKEFLSKNGKKMKSMLRDLHHGKELKYCFLPKQSFQQGGSLQDGLVVDLQDIAFLDESLAKEILDFKIDYRLIKDSDTRVGMNEKFFFEDANDFVIFDGVIKSPWIEYMMQRFANFFARIGIDNAEDCDIDNYCEELWGGC